MAPHLALLAVQTSFSGLHIVGKVVLESLPPLAVASLRVLIAAPLFLGLAWLVDRKLPPPKLLPHLAGLGLLGVFLNQVLFVTGLKYTTATNAAILMSSVPVFAVAISWLTRIEKLDTGRLAGVVLAASGAVILLDPRRFSLPDTTFLGTFLILMNSLSFAAFLVLQRPVLARLPWRTVIAWTFLFGGLGVLAVGGGSLAAVDGATIAPALWWGIAFIGIVPTFFAYLLNTWAVRRSTVTLVAVYTTLQPMLTALLAIMFLGEQLRAPQVVGFLLIASGVWLVSLRSP